MDFAKLPSIEVAATCRPPTMKGSTGSAFYMRKDLQLAETRWGQTGRPVPSQTFVLGQVTKMSQHHQQAAPCKQTTHVTDEKTGPESCHASPRNQDLIPHIHTHPAAVSSLLGAHRFLTIHSSEVGSSDYPGHLSTSLKNKKSQQTLSMVTAGQWALRAGKK